MGDVKLLFGKIDLFSGDGMIPFKIRTIVRANQRAIRQMGKRLSDLWDLEFQIT